MKKDIQKLLSAYETDVADLHGMGRFEVANLLTNRDILEENKSEMTTIFLMSKRYLIRTCCF